MFIMLTGSSGVGKNTLINELMEQNKNIRLMPTLTTRTIRPGEVEGNPFYFLTKEQFEAKIKAKELFEYELIHGNYYGSSKAIFNECIKSGNILMKDIGVEGAANLGRVLRDYTSVIKVFLTTKNRRELVKRLKGRKEKEIKKRLKRFNYEQAQKYKFDFIILNNTKEETLQFLNEVMLNQNKKENIVFTKPFNKINLKKVKALTEEYKLDKREDFVKVYLKEGKIILQNGHEKYLASKLAGKPITKKVVNKCSRQPLNEVEQVHYQTYLKNAS